ncbi:peptidoglycan DD-metalloendopeptidase family protein [Bacillus sp. ISL-35]|uniref:murein hydrolase activator EnvC family protein n=1 Tax=Bacillus sp. ISL-35 TaxID=2819122 RepID=UPI001BE6C9A6|nr:peptidoglycan DD-metalloendopeptidase family protein [Bacillus sp. ISL-35]MBT2704883.1 peptidoglycan DD-metalloendopeptidase family protein [Chryseobacterium sp. ISL-80]
MLKRSVFLAVTIGLAGMSAAYAETTEDLPEIRQKRFDLKQDFTEKEEQIESMDAAEQKYLLELKALDDEVSEINQDIRDLQSIMVESESTAADLKNEIDKLANTLQHREQLIKERLRTMQAQDGLGLYVDLIFDSKNLSQLFDAATAVSTFIKADKDLLAVHQADLELKKKKESALERKIVLLEKDQLELESLEAELQKKVKEKQRLLDSVQKEKQENESELMDMYEVYVNLASQEIAILKENQRVEFSSAQPEDGFVIPARGELTSGYGPRWGRLHAGIDIADESPDSVVVAAASGTVIRSYYSATYGNCVLVTHKIEGRTFTTLYAHLDKSTVTTGKSIKKGEMLGYMGNTGDSRGKHLHFEIHEGQWNYEKSNSVDPLLYVKK